MNKFDGGLTCPCFIVLSRPHRPAEGAHGARLVRRLGPSRGRRVPCAVPVILHISPVERNPEGLDGRGGLHISPTFGTLTSSGVVG